VKYYRVSASRRVDAPPAQVYAVIADYRQHHPHIVPPEYFGRLDVLEGGVGAGTRTRVEMRVLGKTHVFEQLVTEPEPGRVLMEANQDGSAVTTFTVEAAGTSASQVTITTDLAMRPGLTGLLERVAASILFPRIYTRELARLASYVTGLRSAQHARSTPLGSIL
jgi:uncharacterized protein YndB with AHSA1/START domain